MATKLSNPKGKTLEISIVPAMELQFGFETGAGLYTHDGNNLIISFEDGGKIVLSDFYAQAPEELPEFLVEDGVKISSEQFLAQFNDESLLPAAGPAATADTSNAGSGMNSYADDAGSLITGVSRLGGLGNSQWGRSTTIGEGTEQNGVATTAAAAGQINPSSPSVQNPTDPTNPTNPVDPTDPTVPKPDAGFPADVRFVMFRDPSADPDSAWEMTGVVKGATAIDNASLKYGTATIDADGNVKYILDPKYAGEHNPPLVDYITYTGADGKEHSVQVVITTDPKFDDAAKEPGNYNDIEGGISYEVQDGGQAIGNYDTSSSDKDSAKLDGSDFLSYNYLDGGTVNAGRGDDEITIHGGMGNNSTIDAGLGDDKITIAQGMANNSTVDAGTGSNSVTVGGSMSSNSTISAMGDDSAGDKNTIVVKGGMVASTGELNLIESNAGTIDLNEAMIAVDGGTNTINGGSSTVKVDGTSYGMAAMYGGASNSITTTNDVTITTAGIGLGAVDGGTNTIDAKDVTVSAGGYGMNADNGVNTINASGTVNVTASTTADLEPAYGMSADNGGTNTINAGDVTVNATGKYATGVAGSGSGSVNNISATGDIAINATATSKQARGINADANATNTIIAGGNLELVSKGGTGSWGVNAENGGKNIIQMDSGSIYASSDNDAKGIRAGNSGKNEVASASDLTIHVEGKNTSTGIYATTGENKVTVGTLNIDASSSAGLARGVAADANGGKNLITSSGDINISATAANSAIGIYADAKGVNTINSDGSVKINATTTAATGIASGMSASAAGSTNTIDAGKDVTVSGGTTGLLATSGGKNTIKADGEVSVSGGTAGMSASAAGSTNFINAGGDVKVAGGMNGLLATASGNNTIEATGDVNVSADRAGYVLGMSATSKGVNSIKAGGEVTVAATAKTGDAYGLHTLKSGLNTIESNTAVTVDVTANASTAYGMSAFGGGSKNQIVTTNTTGAENGGNVTINAGATGKDSSAYGMYVSPTAGTENSIKAAGDVLVTATAEGKDSTSAYGMSVALACAGEQNGVNSITTADGKVRVEATATTGSAYAMSAMSSGTNIISTTAGGVVDLAATGKAASGMYASDTGRNIVEATGDVTVSATGTSAKGLFATSGGQNTIASSGDVTISATGDIANGMHATSGGKNTIASSGDVTITAETSSGSAVGMWGAGGTNEVSGKNVNVTANSVDGNVWGLSNTNKIVATGDVTIKATTQNGSESSAISGDSDVTAANVNLVASAASKATGIWTQGLNSTINAGNVNIEATAAGEATGMYTTSAGSNTVNASGTVDIKATASNGHAYGIKAENAGANVINAKDVKITVTGNSDYGMKAQDLGSSNTINTTGDATVTGGYSALEATAGGSNTINAGGNASIADGYIAMNANSHGTNIVDAAGNVTVKGGLAINADFDGGVNIIKAGGDITVNGSWDGVKAINGGKNNIEAGGAVDISTGGYYGVFASSAGSSNDIKAAGDINISGGGIALAASEATNIIKSGSNVSVTSDVIGLSASYYGANTIDAVGSVEINAGRSAMMAMGATSTNTIKAGGDVIITADSELGIDASYGGKNIVDSGGRVEINAGWSGLSASSANSTNTINAVDGVTIAVADGAYGVYASFNGANTINSGGDVNITSASTSVLASNGGSNTINAGGTVDITSESRGMSSMSPNSINTINAQDVNISVNSDSSAYGMTAQGANNANIINATGNVNINAELINYANSYAMYTNGAGATNTINAAGAGQGVSITLTASTAMFTSYGGKNTITGSDHSDTVTINGSISGTGNIINTGAGDDKLILNGAIDPSFVFSAGIGTDTLVLTAANQIEFDSYYKDWLTNFFKSPQAKELEQISLNGTNPEDVKWLTDLVNNHNNNNPTNNQITFVDSDSVLLGAEQPAGDEGDHSATAAPMAFGFAPASFKLSGSEVAEDNGFLNLQSTQSTDSLATAHVAVVAQAVEPVEAQATTTHDLQSAVAHELGLTAPETSVADHEFATLEDNASVVSAHHNDYSEISGMLVPSVDGANSGFADSISFEYVAHVTGAEGTSLFGGIEGGHVLEGADSGMIAINSAGNDSVSGSNGNDVFSWHADANQEANADGQGTNVGTIVDFSISGVLEGTFVDGQNGNDKIDLSSLFNEGMQHLNVKSDGLGNAVIEVSASADAPVAQEIVLQDVYSNHSVSSGQEESFNQMILQHIITNNG